MAQQYSLKSGFKLFGVNEEHTVTSDIELLYDMETFAPPDANKITKKYRLDALAPLMFLTEKRDIILKSRTCANVIKQ